MDSPAISSNEQHYNQPRGFDPPCDGAQGSADQDRARREPEQVAQQPVHQHLLVYPTASLEVGVTSRTTGVPCLVPALRNEPLPKDFKGPREVPN